MKAILAQFVREPVRLTAKLLARFAESDTCAPYLVSCFGNPVVLYLSPRFKDVTGYTCAEYQTGGLKFWFSVIHPADLQGVTDRIARAHVELETNPHPKEPLELEYRIRRKDGRVIWIRELKQIASFKEGKRDHILGCLCDITAEKEAEGTKVRELLKREGEINGLLQAAVAHQGNQENGSAESSVRLSAREKQVLQMVAAGNSSKQIAAELSISENTVETHRRHLLEKFKVNNSTALIREAHRLALL